MAELTPDLQERVRSLSDRAAFDLLERTGHEGNVAKWAELTRTLATRLEDVLIDLCRDKPPHTHMAPIGLVEPRPGTSETEREQVPLSRLTPKGRGSRR